MVASFHLVTFRRRQLPLGRARSPRLVPGLHFWQALYTAKDPFTLMPPQVTRLRLLRPNLREWAFFALWDSDTDLDRFLRRSPTAQAWAATSSELWSLYLKPTRARGDWPGIKALNGQEEHGLPHNPAAFLTRLDLPARALGTMWLSAVPKIAPRVGPAPGLITGIPIMDRPYLNPMTFSIWHSDADAIAFAYRGADHQQAVAHLRHRDDDINFRFSSACFLPYRSLGTWKGDNPLAALNSRSMGEVIPA